VVRQSAPSESLSVSLFAHFCRGFGHERTLSIDGASLRAVRVLARFIDKK
jgi:hypothetical protein